MYLQRAHNIVNGYVCVTIEGFYIEKIINICKKYNINLFNIKRKKSTLLWVCVPVNEFKVVAKIVRNNKCRIRINKKKGVPFWINRYRKRKIFLISMILIIIAITVLSNFIWNIDVVGTNNISRDEILEIVKEQGLEIGRFKRNIDVNEIVEKIRLRRCDISWVGIKICGTNARIEIVEADLAPKVINEDEYCNIVATKDALIEKAYAQNGTINVKSGDVVKAGTVLISGWLEGKYTGTRYVHATGKVTGKVWYTDTAKVYLKQKIRKRTGNEECKYSVNINKFAINFYKRLSKFEIYDTIGTCKKLRVSSNFYLPIEIVKNVNYEVVMEDIEYTKDEAKEQAIMLARAKLKEKIGDVGDTVNEYISTSETDEYVEVKITHEVLEDIGTEEKIAL